MPRKAVRTTALGAHAAYTSIRASLRNGGHTREAAPKQGRYPVSDPLREREPAQNILYEVSDMAECWDVTIKACTRPSLNTMNVYGWLRVRTL